MPRPAAGSGDGEGDSKSKDARGWVCPVIAAGGLTIARIPLWSAADQLETGSLLCCIGSTGQAEQDFGLCGVVHAVPGLTEVSVKEPKDSR